MPNNFGIWLVNQLTEIKTILTEARQSFDDDLKNERISKAKSKVEVLESFCDEVLNKKG